MAAKWCLECALEHLAVAATVVIDGDPMCNAHALAAGRTSLSVGKKSGVQAESRLTPVPIPVDVPVDPPVVTAAEPVKEKGKGGFRVDTLVARTESLDSLPKPMKLRRAMGRAGKLFEEWKALGPNQMKTVECRDLGHATQTDSGLRKNAKQEGLAVASQKSGFARNAAGQQVFLYHCWKPVAGGDV